MSNQNQKTWERQQFERDQIKRYGVITYSRQSSERRLDITVIPIELEKNNTLDSSMIKARIIEKGNPEPAELT
jgi:hypothetical protein